MTFPNLASSARNLHGFQRVLVVALLLLGTVVFGYLAVAQSGTAHVSSWYPAAGVGVVAAVAVSRRYRYVVLPLVSLSTFAVSLAGGRPLAVAIVGSIAIAVEAGIVTAFVVDRDDQPRLTSTHDVIRFFVGVLLGTFVMGVSAATAVSLTSDADFVSTAFSVMASHASAIVVIAPIALVNRMKRPMGSAITRTVHGLLLIGAVAVSFAPGSTAPLAFLPIPFLAWAAFSFSMSFALLELILASAETVLFTTFGGGPFGQTDASWLQTAALLELYVITLSVTTLLIASARNERQMLEEQKSATAQLLHSGFEAAQNGFAIVQEHEGVFSVMEFNSAAVELMPLSLTPTGEFIPGSPVLAALTTMVAEGTTRVVLVNDDDASNIPASLTVSVVRNSTFGEILLLSVVDLRAVREAEEAAALQLEREQLVIEELRALNQQKDDFVASVTHELRTPITTVMGFSEELEDTTLDEVQRNYVTIIQRNAERLLSVVEDVLTFSKRVPGSGPASSASPVDITETIALVLDDLRHSIRDKNISVTVELPDGPMLVLVDPNNLTRVIINLLTNSVKFTPADGALAIVGTLGHGGIDIAITDNGPGVAAGDLDKVFDRFYRSSRAAHDGVPGTGLGLSIVRELVTEMNGSIVLESDGSSGTTAHLTLPVSVTAQV